MSIFHFFKKRPVPLSDDIDSIKLMYTSLQQAFDEMTKDREESIDFIEYTLFLLAFTLSVHTWSRGKIEARVRNKFINDQVLDTINHVRLELPYDRRPRFFRGNIVHIPDMKNWLGSLVVKKMQGYLGSFTRDGFAPAILPVVKRAEKDIFVQNFEAVTDEQYETLQTRIEAIAQSPADRV